MSQIKQKSDQNRKAARFLLDKELYAPSLHCAYYCVFQLMRYIMKNTYKLGYLEQEKEIAEWGKRKVYQGIRMHEYIILRFGSEVKKISDNDYLYFERNIKDLKKFRIQSDYHNVFIDPDKSKKAVKISEEVYSKMIELFQL